jgi:hypothetical protein
MDHVIDLDQAAAEITARLPAWIRVLDRTATQKSA